METARASGRPVSEVYRDLRAAAESGWDFSSRWLQDGVTLATIHTTELIPPDLNSLLYKLELTIAKACALAEDSACATQMRARAAARRSAMTHYLWNAKLGAFTDYDFRASVQGRGISAATLYPLYVHASTPAQARSVAALVRSRLLAPRGLATTTLRTGQQWDAPNGWAPLQWIAVMGLRGYGEPALASAIARRWIQANLELYRQRGRLVEKYDVQTSAAAGGGEYPTQDGFGWSNGVLRKLLTLYPASKAARTAPQANVP
jgi:alpha,alpha-trehalase